MSSRPRAWPRLLPPGGVRVRPPVLRRYAHPLLDQVAERLAESAERVAELTGAAPECVAEAPGGPEPLADGSHGGSLIGAQRQFRIHAPTGLGAHQHGCGGHAP